MTNSDNIAMSSNEPSKEANKSDAPGVAHPAPQQDQGDKPAQTKQPDQQK